MGLGPTPPTCIKNVPFVDPTTTRLSPIGQVEPSIVILPSFSVLLWLNVVGMSSSPPKTLRHTQRMREGVISPI